MDVIDIVTGDALLTLGLRALDLLYFYSLLKRCAALQFLLHPLRIFQISA